MKTIRCLAAVLVACVGLAAASAQKPAEVFTHGDLQRQLTALVQASHENGSSGSTLGDYKSHALKLSVRTASGGAEVHAHFDDVMVVLDGSATLVTGGKVVDGKTAANGETKGKSIEGGEKHTVRKGDIIHVPAGTPHQLILPKGGEFSAFVVKVHE